MQPAAFTPTQEGCFGEAGPPHVALFGPSVVTQVQRPDPRASGARGVARPKPGPGRGAGPERRDVTPARMAARCPQAPSGLSPGMQPAAFTPTQKAASGRLDTPHVALFGPSVVTQVQRHDPRACGARGVANPKHEPGRGAGPLCGDVTPGSMAAGVLKPHQACPPECNQPPSRPLGRLLRGGWTPTRGPFRA